MTLSEFEQQVFHTAVNSKICGIPIIRRLSFTAINIRINLTAGGFIDAFYNEQTGTTAYTLINRDRRLFGADNTGGWHIHPFDDPALHIPISNRMPFAEFVAEIERYFLQ